MGKPACVVIKDGDALDGRIVVEEYTGSPSVGAV
jgi:hypothetical protein